VVVGGVEGMQQQGRSKLAYEGLLRGGFGGLVEEMPGAGFAGEEVVVCCHGRCAVAFE